MFGKQPSKEVAGPSEETNREVAARAIVAGSLMIGGYGGVEYFPTGSTVEGISLVLVLAALIYGSGWFSEGIARAYLWKDTRGYDNE